MRSTPARRPRSVPSGAAERGSGGGTAESLEDRAAAGAERGGTRGADGHGATGLATWRGRDEPGKRWHRADRCASEAMWGTG